MTDLLVLEEVAAVMRVPVSSVRYWIRKGRLQSLKPGRRVLVRRTELQDFLTRSERGEAISGGETEASRSGQ
jgi:excisionase family DNA binding protein